VAVLPWAGLALLGMALIAFSAAAEMAFASVSRAQLRQVLAVQKARAQVAASVLGEPARLLSTLLLTKLIGFVSVTAATMSLAETTGYGRWLGWWLAGATILMLLAQLLPRAWTIGREERVALRLARSVRIFTWLLSPVTALMRRAGHAAAPAGAAEESIFLSEDGLRFLLNVTEEETVIEEDEKEMIASIFEFGDKLVREVMVPRIDVASVPADLPMLAALDVILKAGHSRIPVYSTSVDNVIGVLYAKDLLRYLRDGRTDVPLGKILRPAYFVPESKKVDELLGELQQRKVHMAIVVDEYGGTAGIVTIEDLLEEIVGEIQDEYDAEEPTVEEVADDQFLFDARVPLDEVNKLLGVELPAEGGDTLGGFIYSELGKVPAVGDTIARDTVRIEVLSVAGRRIKQVRASVTAVDASNGRAGENANERAGE
jgi:CBS domain containing-hemolysin-like protein